MIDRVMIFGIIASTAALLFVLELVRRRKLREDYSLLWLMTGIVLLLLSLSRPALDTLANALGVVTYPPAALFAVALLFVLFILLHYSVVITRLSRENKQMAQQMAIVRWELEDARERLAAIEAGSHQDRRDPQQRDTNERR
jgi:hypothetical protein